MKKEPAKYFVGSNGEEPEQLFFDLAVAMKADCTWIDGFDAKGNHVKAWKREDFGRYTDKF